MSKIPIHAATGNPVSEGNAKVLSDAAARLGLDPAGPWATYNGWRAMGRQVPRGCKAPAKITAPRGRDDNGQRFGRVAVWHRSQTVERDDVAAPSAPAKPRVVDLPGDAYADGVGVVVDAYGNDLEEAPGIAAYQPPPLPRTAPTPRRVQAPRVARGKVRRARGGAKAPPAGSMLAAVAAVLGGGE